MLRKLHFRGYRSLRDFRLNLGGVTVVTGENGVGKSNIYPSVSVARETLLSWRFYHHFPTDARSPLRQPVIGSWSPVLDADGGNLASNLRTLFEFQRSGPLDEAVEAAFPGCEWSPVDDSGGVRDDNHCGPRRAKVAKSSASISSV